MAHATLICACGLEHFSLRRPSVSHDICINQHLWHNERVTTHENNDYVGALDTAVDDVRMLPTPADAAQELSKEPVDRGDIIAADGRTAAAWALRFIIIVAATAILLYLLKWVWMGLLPIPVSYTHLTLPTSDLV